MATIEEVHTAVVVEEAGLVLQAEDEAETMMAMSEAIGFVEGREAATLDLLLEMLDRVQKDEVLKQEAHDFARQVLEEERDAEFIDAARVEAARAEDEAFARQWAERARERIGLLQPQHDQKEASSSSSSSSPSSADAATSAASSKEARSGKTEKKKKTESVVGSWRAKDKGSEKQAEIKRTLQLDEEWAHWAEEDD